MQKRLSLRYIITATFLGNTLEWYDAALFGFFIPIFTTLFFSQDEMKTALFQMLLLFAVGSMIRPLGGFIFGYIGDRYGRRKALLASVSLMVVPVVAMSALPTYAQIGAFAWISLCFLRMLQSIAVGGEFPGCVSFIVESSPPHSRGFFGSFAFFGQVFGIFLGALDFYLIKTHLSQEDFLTWGWRILCLTGALLGVAAFWMRLRLVETPYFNKMRDSSEILRDPISNLFRLHKKNLMKFIGIEILETLMFYLLVVFSMTYFIEEFHTSLSQSIGWNLLTLSSVLIVLPFFGKLASHLGPLHAARYSALAILILALPLYWMMQTDHLRLFSMVFLGILYASYIAPMPTIFCQLFPTNIRFSGIGIAFSLSNGIIGGFTPFLAMHSIKFTGFVPAPSLFLIAGAILSLLTLRTIKPHDL